MTYRQRINCPSLRRILGYCPLIARVAVFGRLVEVASHPLENDLKNQCGEFDEVTSTQNRRFAQRELKLPTAVIEDIKRRAKRERVSWDHMFNAILKEGIEIAEAALAKREVCA